MFIEMQLTINNPEMKLIRNVCVCIKKGYDPFGCRLVYAARI